MDTADDSTRRGAGLLLTIGYGSNRSPEVFIELLHRYQIDFLADVRSRPYSRFRPEFSRESLAVMVQRAGIGYLFMGDALGGHPDDATCYVNDKVDYSLVRRKEWFVKGIERLLHGWRDGRRIALMCAEIEPDRCHRSRLIGETLVARGVEVSHVNKEGDAITHAAAMARVTRGQLALFEAEQTSRRADRPASREARSAGGERYG